MNASAEVLQRLLARMPSVAWSARMNLATGESSWIYVDSKLAAVYDVPEAEVGVFMTDGVTPFPNEQQPLSRALAGEESPEAEMLLRSVHFEGERRVRVNGVPVRDGSGKIIAGMVVVQDNTQPRALERELRARSEQLAESEAAKTVLIERLRYRASGRRWPRRWWTSGWTSGGSPRCATSSTACARRSATRSASATSGATSIITTSTTRARSRAVAERVEAAARLPITFLARRGEG